jgi:hypothetical protein
MTSITTLEKFVTAAKDHVGEAFYSDTWRSTSYLIQLMNKMESYFESLNADDPESDYFTAQIAVSSALNLISNSYNCPIDDDRFELVKEAYESTVNLFITEFSDDAMADLILLGNLANFVAEMRVHSINMWIEETAPSEQKFEMLKLAKRDEKAVELAVKTAADVLFAD